MNKLWENVHCICSCRKNERVTRCTVNPCLPTSSCTRLPLWCRPGTIWGNSDNSAGFWQVVSVIGVNFPSDLSFPPFVNTSSVLIFSQQPCHRRCCSWPAEPSPGSPTAALIQRRRCRTAVCTEIVLRPLPSHALAGCIHLSNWGWPSVCCAYKAKGLCNDYKSSSLGCFISTEAFGEEEEDEKEESDARQKKAEAARFEFFQCPLFLDLNSRSQEKWPREGNWPTEL